MLLHKNNGISLGYWLFGLLCAAIGFIATYTVHRAKSLFRSLKPASKEVVLTPTQVEKVRQSFFNATFSIMGHVARADGPIQKSQIALAKDVMKRMELDARQCARAIELFNSGKQSDFDLDRQAKRFRDGCVSSTDQYRVFLETQIEVALANGHMAPRKEAILLHVAKVLGIGESAYKKVEVPVRVSLGLGDNHNSRYRPASSRTVHRKHRKQSVKLAKPDAYSVLGVKQDDHRATVKAAYRKLMNQYHPDKLESKGLPKEMLKLSTDKAQKIQQAYEQIKLAKCW